MRLHPVEGQDPPLPEIRIHPEDDRLGLAVIIPDDQAPGRYSGAVLRRDDGAVLGAICIDVPER